MCLFKEEYSGKSNFTNYFRQKVHKGLYNLRACTVFYLKTEDLGKLIPNSELNYKSFTLCLKKNYV